MGFLHGKRALITGVLNHRSIAWGIASAMHREGAELAFTYVNDKLKDRVDEAAAAFCSNIVLPCDVADDAQIDALFPALAQHWTASILWCTRSATRRARRWPASSSMA